MIVVVLKRELFAVVENLDSVKIKKKDMNGFLNAKGRRASLPRAKRNEDIREYANRTGYTFLDPDNILGDRAGCSCRCVGHNTGEGEGGIYEDFPDGIMIKCCGGRNCAHVPTFGGGAKQLIVEPLTNRVPSGVRPRPTSNKPPRRGKPVAKGSGRMIKTRKGLMLVNDIGNDIPVGKTSHPCCNGGNLCNSTFNCLDGSGSYPIVGCCGSTSYCSGLEGILGDACGGAYEIVPSPHTPNQQGSTNFRGRDLSNGGFTLR